MDAVAVACVRGGWVNSSWPYVAAVYSNVVTGAAPTWHCAGRVKVAADVVIVGSWLGLFH